MTTRLPHAVRRSTGHPSRRRRLRNVSFLALLTVGLGCIHSEPDAPLPMSAPELLAADDDEGFERALEPRTFAFPADHGPHGDYRTEWWYLTGNLETRDRNGEPRPFGYQLTFFRNGLVRQPATRASAWATHEVYLAHLGLTDIASGRFYSFERFGRGSEGLAGAQTQPFRVYLDDWQLISKGADTFPIDLVAAEAGVRLELEIDQGKRIVLQGNGGLSAKSSKPGSASYYYSLTRMPTHGRLELGDKSFEVEGNSWMDREWSTSVLDATQAGWDWFSLQLDNDWELMLFELRRRDGSHDFGSGKLIAPDGSAQTLDNDAFVVEVTDHWQSPHSAARYPAAWRVILETAGLDLRIEPRASDQEHHGAFRYWEGAVSARGTFGSAEVTGVGYVEMTGYGADNATPRLR